MINSIDSILLGGNFIQQIRCFSITEKIKNKSRQIQQTHGSLIRTHISFTNNNWTTLNQITQTNRIKQKSKTLIIYPYSLSNNLLKEVLLKIRIKFTLTSELKKATIIIGLKKHIQKNLSLTKLANKFNIPIYNINCISYYQLTRLFSKIN